MIVNSSCYSIMASDSTAQLVMWTSILVRYFRDVDGLPLGILGTSEQSESIVGIPAACDCSPPVAVVATGQYFISKRKHWTFLSPLQDQSAAGAIETQSHWLRSTVVDNYSPTISYELMVRFYWLVGKKPFVIGSFRNECLMGFTSLRISDPQLGGPIKKAIDDPPWVEKSAISRNKLAAHDRADAVGTRTRSRPAPRYRDRPMAGPQYLTPPVQYHLFYFYARIHEFVRVVHSPVTGEAEVWSQLCFVLWKH